MALRFHSDAAFQQWLKHTTPLRKRETDDLDEEIRLAVDDKPPKADTSYNKHWFYEYVEYWVLTAVCLGILGLLATGYIR